VSTLNFEQAIDAHSNWKWKLSNYIQAPDHSINSATLAKDNLCELGKWIAENAGKYKSDDFNVLRSEHTEFHRLAADVVRRADAGECVSQEVAVEKKSPYGRCSMNVVLAIKRIQRTAR
jgi:hypothetical protein